MAKNKPRKTLQQCLMRGGVEGKIFHNSSGHPYPFYQIVGIGMNCIISAERAIGARIIDATLPRTPLAMLAIEQSLAYLDDKQATRREVEKYKRDRLKEGHKEGRPYQESILTKKVGQA